MKNSKGFSLIEVVVPMSFVAVLGGLAATGLTDQGWLGEDEEFVATAEERTAIQETVAALNGLSLDVVRTNVSLGADHHLASVRDGVIIRTSGHDQVVGLAIMPEDRDGDGVQDFLDVDYDGRPDDFITNNDGQTDGTADLKWQLVTQTFANIDEAMDVTRWSGARVLARSLVPFVTDSNGLQGFDTLACNHVDAAIPHGVVTMKLVQAESTRRNRVVEDHNMYELTTSDGLLSTQDSEPLDRTATLTAVDGTPVHG